MVTIEEGIKIQSVLLNSALEGMLMIIIIITTITFYTKQISQDIPVWDDESDQMVAIKWKEGFRIQRCSLLTRRRKEVDVNYNTTLTFYTQQMSLDIPDEMVWDS